MLAHCVFVCMQVYLLNPLENLRSYINNRPPLVIFMISVSAVAIAFLTIGYFFKIKEIKSPELTEVRLKHVSNISVISNMVTIVAFMPKGSICI